MPSPDHRIRSFLRATAPFGAVIAIVVLFLPLSRSWDLGVFLRAGGAVLHGLPVYPRPGTPAVYSGFSFVYPYFAVLPFVPLAALPADASTAIFFGISSVAVIAACTVGAEAGPWAAALVLCTTFTITGLQLGALSPLLFAGAMFMWRLRDRPIPFALVAAPVVASKLFLFPLLAWPLLAGRRRAFLWALGATVALLAAGFLLGPLNPMEYLRLLSQLGAHEAKSGFGLISALRNAGLAPGSAQLVAVTLGVALFVAAYWHYRRTADERVVFCAGIIASLLLTPVLWSHYLVLLAAALLALGAPLRWLGAFAAASWLIAAPHGINVHVPLPEQLEARGAWLAVAVSLVVFGYAARAGRERSG
jgi:alpha-1,2-mannosyltransferase